MDANSTMPAENGRRTDVLIELSLLFLVCLLLVVPGALPGRTLGGFWLSEHAPGLPRLFQNGLLNDAEKLRATQTVPFTEYSARRLKQGQLPLWDPHTGFGGPFLGNGRAAPFYPTVVLHFWGNAKWAWLLDHLVHFLAAGCGTWLLARRVISSASLSTQHSALSTLLPALGFLAVVAHVMAVDLLQAHVVVLLPWALLALDRLIDRLSAPRLLACITVLVLQFLGGHGAASSGLILSMAMWLVMRAVCPSGRADAAGAWAALRTALPLLAACVIAFMTAGLQWVPTLYNRGNIGEDPVNAALMAATPEKSAFWWTGAAMLVIAGVGCALSRNWGRIVPLAVIAALCMALTHVPWIEQKLRAVSGPDVPTDAGFWKSMGLYALGWLAQVPRAIRVTALAPMAGLMLALLAGMGASHLAQRFGQPEVRRLLPSLGLGAVGALAVALAMFFLRQANLFLLLIPLAVGLGALMALVLKPLSAERVPYAMLVIAGVELLVLALPMHLGMRIEQPDAALTALAAKTRESHQRVTTADPALLPGHAAMALDIRDARGAAATGRARRILSATRPADLQASLGAARFVLQRASTGWTVSENVGAGTRLWVVPSLSPVSKFDDVVTSLASRPLDPKRPTIDGQNIHPYGFSTELTPGLTYRSGGLGRSEVRWTVLRDTPEELRLQIPNPGGYLVINEAFAPGWQAFGVPGTQGQRKLERPVAVLPAFGFLRAVPLASRGEMVLSVRYQPRGVFRGMLASAAGLMLFLIVAVWPLFSAAPARVVEPRAAEPAPTAAPVAASALAAAPASVVEAPAPLGMLPVEPPEAVAPVEEQVAVAPADNVVDEQAQPIPGTLDSPPNEVPARLDDQASALRELAAEVQPPEESEDRDRVQ